MPAPTLRRRLSFGSLPAAWISSSAWAPPILPSTGKSTARSAAEPSLWACSNGSIRCSTSLPRCTPQTARSAAYRSCEVLAVSNRGINWATVDSSPKVSRASRAAVEWPELRENLWQIASKGGTAPQCDDPGRYESAQSALHRLQRPETRRSGLVAAFRHQVTQRRTRRLALPPPPCPDRSQCDSRGPRRRPAQPGPAVSTRRSGPPHPGWRFHSAQPTALGLETGSGAVPAGPVARGRQTGKLSQYLSSNRLRALSGDNRRSLAAQAVILTSQCPDEMQWSLLRFRCHPAGQHGRLHNIGRNPFQLRVRLGPLQPPGR